MIFDSLSKYKNKIAITENEENITYNSLNSLCKKFNFEKNKLILILSENNIETIVLYLSSLKIKTSVYLIDSKCNDSFLRKTINIYKPDYIAYPSNRRIKILKYKINSDFRNYKILELKKKKNNLVNNNLAIVLTTSGTTGTQKLAKLSYKNLKSNAKSISKYLKIKKSDCSITTLPIFYSYGLSVINSHLFSGSRIILNRYSLLENKFWLNIKKFNVTNFSTVPFFYEILKKINFDKYKIKKLRFVTVAGGKLDLKTEKFYNSFFSLRKIEFIKMYGATEASPRISYLNPKFNEKKIGSIGKAIPGGKLFLQDKNGKFINKKNTNGEIVYKGPNVFMGYAFSRNDLSYDNTSKFLKTGDIGYFDKDGFFYITGRIKRIAKIFGHRINLDEIESKNKILGFQNITISDDKKIIIFLKKKDRNRSVEEILKNININSSYVKFIYIQKFPINNSNKVDYEKLRSIYL